MKDRFSLRGSKTIVVLLLLLAAAVNENATAATVAVQELRTAPPPGAAYGLYVPGRGAEDVTRAKVLERVGGLRRGTAGVKILLRLPGDHAIQNHPLELAIAGDGYRGVLVDRNTHIPGLVSIDSLRETIRDLEDGVKPPITARPDAHAQQTVARLNARLREAHDARSNANIALAMLMVWLALPALVTRSAYLARAAILAPPAMLALGLAWRSALALCFGALAVALALAVPRRAFRPLCALVLAGALLVLWQWPVTNALATIGPHPDGGGRFYGVTNQVETLLLPHVLIAGLALAPLALFTIGWSKAGADGGGLLVYAAGYAMLALRTFGRLTPRRVLLGVAAVVAVAVVVVAVDAATGGSSHVTHALGSGLPGDLAHRWRVSERGATRTFGAFLMFATGVILLLLLARVRPRPPRLDAMLVALAVSLIVNDTPQDVMLWGGLGALSLLAWERCR
jgi:hypothetical protein